MSTNSQRDPRISATRFDHGWQQPGDTGKLVWGSDKNQFSIAFVRDLRGRAAITGCSPAPDSLVERSLDQALQGWLAARERAVEQLVPFVAADRWRNGVATSPETWAALAHLYAFYTHERTRDITTVLQAVMAPVERDAVTARLKAARRKGFLTPTRHGVAAGEATPEAHRVLPWKWPLE